MSDGFDPKTARLDSPFVSQSDNPWLDWLEAVGIAAGFPTLRALRWPAPERDDLGRERPTDDSRRWFLNRPHLLKLNEIYESLSAARVVTTATGHGATTLARYLYQQAEEDTLIRRSVPVLVSLEDLLEPDYDEMLAIEREALRVAHPHLEDRRYGEDVEELKLQADERANEFFSKLTSTEIRHHIERSVHEAVVRSLVTRPWERAMTRSRYRDLLEAASPLPDDLAYRRADLARFVTEGSFNESAWNVIREKAPRLAPDDYRVLIAELASACNVRISLILDLSATPIGRLYAGEDEGEYLTEPYLDTLGRTVTAIKNIEQAGGRGPTPPLPSLLDKTYIMGGNAWAEFQRDYSEQTDNVIEFPLLRPFDVFAMLAYHYPPHQDDTGRRAEALAAVVDSTFVRISSSRALSTEMAILEAELSHHVTQGGDVTYQISSPDSGATSSRTVVSALVDIARALDRHDLIEDLAGKFSWIARDDNRSEDDQR